MHHSAVMKENRLNHKRARREKRILAICTVFLAASFVFASDIVSKERLSASITVNTGVTIEPVNRLIFGNNVEAADNTGLYAGAKGNIAQMNTGDGFWDPVRRIVRDDIRTFAKALNIGMLRYPGGCLVHTFDWKKTVGPLETRSNYRYGLDEFIETCRVLHAEPLIMVSDYTGTAEDAADLVAYCNAPADAKHPWAQKRAAWGHAEPYRVKYFELGNETDHGNHYVKPFRQMSATQYAAYVREYAVRMKAVDASIRIGALMGTGTGSYDPWNEKVLAGVKDNADFIVVHTYAVGATMPNTPSDVVMRAAMASSDDFTEELSQYRQLIHTVTGRDIPLAVTEYNGGTHNFSFGIALFSADYMRSLMEPAKNVLMANYWHLLNGAFGMLYGGYDGKIMSGGAIAWKMMPAYHLFSLWGSHFGTELVKTDIVSPKASFEGLGRARARQPYPNATIIEPTIQLKAGRCDGASWSVTQSNTIILSLKGFRGITYPEIVQCDVSGAVAYRFSFTARTRGETGAMRIGLGLSDVRGWSATKSAIGIHGIEEAIAPERFRGIMNTLNDAKGLSLVWRLLNDGGTPVTAEIEVSDIRLMAAPPGEPYDVLTAIASTSANSDTAYLLVFNKHDTEEIAAAITLAGKKYRSAALWTITAPSLSVTNIENVPPAPMPLSVSTNVISHVFPPRSMSAIEVYTER